MRDGRRSSHGEAGLSVEGNVKLAIAFEEAFNARDWEGLGTTLTASVVMRDPFLPEPILGREGVVGMFQAFVEAMPSAHIEGLRWFGQGDWVCVEALETGSDKDSGAIYRTESCLIFRVAEDKLAELRFYYDAYQMVRQVEGFPLILQPSDNKPDYLTR